MITKKEKQKFKKPKFKIWNFLIYRAIYLLEFSKFIYIPLISL